VAPLNFKGSTYHTKMFVRIKAHRATTNSSIETIFDDRFGAVDEYSSIAQEDACSIPEV
jgi:hypothetical protein